MACEYGLPEEKAASLGLKRRYGEMVHAHDVYAEIYTQLRQIGEREGIDILRRIRSGYAPDAVLAHIRQNAAAWKLPDARRIAVDIFLITLTQSTASLQEITRSALPILDPAHGRLPDPRCFYVLRNRVVRLQDVETLVRRAQPLEMSPAASSQDRLLTSPTGDARTNDPEEDRDGDGHHLHYVPAAPWTQITASDDAVSHLVSVFLTWINPTWRFVEPDLFLRGEPYWTHQSPAHRSGFVLSDMLIDLPPRHALKVGAF